MIYRHKTKTIQHSFWVATADISTRDYFIWMERDLKNEA